MHKATIIVPWFGKLPDYTPYFLKSCGYNSDFKWIIFSDRDEFPSCPQNVHFKYLTQIQFDEIASLKLGFRVKTFIPYKLCDFKPALGFIFREYLGQVPFWGYCDLDMIFGRLGQFISSEYFENVDILSFYTGFLSGPFSLFRNTDQVIQLFKSCKAYRRIFQDPEYSGFDENIYQPEIAGISIKKMFQMLIFSAKNPGLIINTRELRYQYQWYVKRRAAISQSPVDMTEAIHTANRKKSVKAMFRNDLLTDPYFSRTGRKNWQLEWNKGILSDHDSKKEYMAFHFQENKLRSEFKIVQPNNEFSRFTVSPSGICP